MSVRLALHLGGLSAFNIAFTFFQQVYVVASLGPAGETDALFASTTVPQLFLSVVSGSLLYVLIPLLSGEAEDQLKSTVWCTVVWIGALFSIVAGVLYVLAPYFAPLLVPGFDSARQSLVVDLTRVQLIGMILVALNTVQIAAYQARHRFLATEYASLVANAIALVAIVLTVPMYGIQAVAWVAVLRGLLQVLFLLPGLGLPQRIRWEAGSVKEGVRRVLPLVLGNSYYK